MKIGYWKGVIVKDHIEERCREALNLLSLGEYASLHLEKLAVPGEKIYSIRVNIVDRLIMTEHRGMLVVLDYVENHNYHKSHFLEKGGLKRYLRSQGANLEEAIAAGFLALDDATEVAQVAGGVGDDNPIAWQEIERHDARWIQLTQDQEEGLSARLPMIVKGSAGSGKSTLALSMLVRDLERHEAELPRVYLCESSILRAQIYRRWCGMGLDEALWRDKVLFLTIGELLKQYFLGPECTIVKPEIFSEWFKTYVKKTLIKSSHQEKNLEVSLVWEEVQKCAVCKTADEYYELGQRQSSLDRDEREYVYKAYLAYAAYLKITNQVSPELFVTEAIQPLFSLLMIDESQNLSPAEVGLLLPLALHNNAVIFAGDQQVITSSCPNLQVLRSHFYKLGVEVSEVTLPVTHRCPNQVVTLVNELTRFKRLVAGGRADKNEQDKMVACEGAIEGEVEWYTPDTMDRALLQQRSRHIDFAVVTRPEYKDQVKALFPTGAVVFTVDEVQGLDIPDLLVFNIFEEGICCKIVPLLESKEQKQHLAKAGQADWSSNREFDSLITILTRTERTLTIVNEASRYTTQVMAHLRHLNHPLEAKATAAAPRKLHAPSTDREWVAKASAYLLSGHEEQALQIWINMLGRQASDFALFKDDLLGVAEKEQPLALAKASDRLSIDDIAESYGFQKNIVTGQNVGKFFDFSTKQKPFLMLINDLESNAADPAPRLYLVHSSEQASKIAKTWQHMKLAKESWRSKVLILTYEGLIQQFFLKHEKVNKLNWANVTVFIQWMISLPKKDPLKVEFKKRIGQLNEENCFSVWKEILQCRTHKTADEYYQLEQKRTVCSIDVRDFIYRVCISYVDYLKETQQISPELFLAEKAHPIFSFLIVDNSDHMTSAEMVILGLLTINKKCVFFGDDYNVVIFTQSPDSDKPILSPLAIEAPVNPVEKLTRNEQYIHDLVVKNKFNREDVTFLLNHKNVNKFLFEIPYKDHDCLLKYVLSTAHCLEVFKQVLMENPKQAGKVFSYMDVKKSKIGIEFFIDFDEFDKFNQMALLNALANDIDFCCEITAKALHIVFKHINHPLVLDILALLLRLNPQLSQGITAETLMLKKYGDDSLLRQLIRTPKGERLIELLFQQNGVLRDSLGTEFSTGGPLLFSSLSNSSSSRGMTVADRRHLASNYLAATEGLFGPGTANVDIAAPNTLGKNLSSSG